MKMATWPSHRASFAYRGQQSGWMDEWPAQDLSPGVLPHRIKLVLDDGDVTREIYAAVQIRRTGRYDYRDFFE